MKDLISVIVAVYNTEKYLDRCVEGIVAQTYKNLEIILVDDGSYDNCPAMCDAWAKRDNRIRVIHKENDGQANARNSGLEIMTGDYVLYVDSDDFVEPDMIEFLYTLITESNADISRCGFYLDYEEDGRTESASADQSVRCPDSTEVMIDLLSGSHISGVVWNKLYRADLVKGCPFEKADGCSEDLLYNYRLFKNNPKLVFCDKPKYHYFINNQSITNSKFGYGAFAIIRAKNIILDELSDNEALRAYAVKSYILSAFIVLTGCIKNNGCMDRYDELRNGILSHKREIFFSGMYSKMDKLKTLILLISSKLFNKLTRMRG